METHQMSLTLPVSLLPLNGELNFQMTRSGRRIRSTKCICIVYGCASTSSHVLSVNPPDSTTNVSPSQCPVNCPIQVDRVLPASVARRVESRGSRAVVFVDDHNQTGRSST